MQYVDEYAEAQAVTPPGVWCVTETPDDPSLNPVWVDFATDAVDALNRAAATFGYGPYDRDPELRASVGILGDETGSDAIGAWATFENTTWHSVLVEEV